MTDITAEDIVRGMVEDCGWQLLSFRRGDQYVSMTVCHPYYGVPVIYGYGTQQPYLTLGDETLDKLREFLTGDNEEWWK